MCVITALEELGIDVLDAVVVQCALQYLPTDLPLMHFVFWTFL